MNLAHEPASEQRSESALNARLEESMAQIERGEGIPGDRILDVLAKRRAVREPRP